MAHGYNILEHWDRWLGQQFLGRRLLEAELNLLSPILKKHFGKHGLLLGVPRQYTLLRSTVITYRTLMSTISTKEHKENAIVGNFQELPFLSGSIDLVMLPHTLELVDNARQLLAEACRVIKPEGLIVICGFNPYSAWGVKKVFTKQNIPPWSGNFIHFHQIKRWLQLADFELEQQQSFLYRPPINHPVLYRKLKFLEQLGNKCFPLLGGVYILLARAKVVPLTPIKLQWKQGLSGIRISTNITWHIVGRAK